MTIGVRIIGLGMHKPHMTFLRELEAAGRAKIVGDAAFASLASQKAGALMISGDNFFNSRSEQT